MRVLEWDSDFFGVRVGRTEPAGEPFAAAVEAARAERVECLYVHVPAERVELVTEAVRAGALLVDLRVRLELELGAANLPPPDGRARPAGPDDLAALEPLAVALAAYSRFRRDPGFEPARVNEMYRVWVRRCLEEGVVATAADGPNGLVGVLDGSVDLVYVDPAAGGQGLGRALMVEALRALPGPSASVATQAGNVPALRLYEELGFRARSVDAILHLWLRERR